MSLNNFKSLNSEGWFEQILWAFTINFGDFVGNVWDAPVRLYCLPDVRGYIMPYIQLMCALVVQLLLIL